MYEHKEPRLTKSGKIDKRFAKNGLSQRWTPENMQKHGEKKRAEWGRKREDAKKRNEEIAYRYEGNPVLDLSKPVAPGEEAESNTKKLKEARVAMGLPRIDTKDAAQVERRINEYLDFCEVNNKMPQLKGLGNWIGLTTRQLDYWKNGKTQHEGAQVFLRFISMLEEIMVEKTIELKGNPANLIFLLKNMFGYKDQTDIVFNQNDDDVQDMSKEDLEKWFLEDGKQIVTTFADEQNEDKK